jgi:hypothetical protein
VIRKVKWILFLRLMKRNLGSRIPSLIFGERMVVHEKRSWMYLIHERDLQPVLHSFTQFFARNEQDVIISVIALPCSQCPRTPSSQSKKPRYAATTCILMLRVPVTVSELQHGHVTMNSILILFLVFVKC